ncbi:MAG: hypothetical protein A2Z72_00150 [Omnitrophica bacterium RBG_13_46_9]|nr:MAG: hypothetical protein A2Z72_00150 [Omnitrophica bacterium RBG_13_46_9]
MKIAIVGLSGCGKSTCFRAITQKTKRESEGLDPTKPHLGVVKVPDWRLEMLKSLFNPKKITPAEITFEDLPGFHIPHIKEIEALMEVLGVFAGRDPVKDMDDIGVEFILADTEVVKHRLSSLDKEMKQDRSPEKTREHETLLKCRECLERNMPIRSITLTHDEEKSIRGFQFLTGKPIVIVGNIGEDQTGSGVTGAIEAECARRGFKSVEFCAELEAEIADIDEPERGPFLKELGIEQLARDRVIDIAYQALGYITFFTTKGDETKAWPVKNGVTALEAAGKIHSDIQRGFIRAEIVNFTDLEACGSVQEARKKALVRLEGKEYVVRDGDIVDFRFNV